MFSSLKGVSKVSLAAVAGFGAAMFGAFLGWILFPVLVSLNIDKVYILFIDLFDPGDIFAFLCSISMCCLHYFR